MYGKDSYFSGSMLVFRYFYGVFMPGLRSRGNGGSSPILDKLESFVAVVIELGVYSLKIGKMRV